MTTPAPAPAATSSRAGRNLPVAILVGCSLGAVVAASLFIRKEAFVVLVLVAISLGTWEMREGLSQGHIHVPIVPVLVGAAAMLTAAFVSGGQALTVCFGLTCLAVLFWRMADGPAHAVRDVAGGVFVAAYLPFLASFTSLMLAEDDGAQRIFVFILLVVCSDVGGYALGVVAGKHPMAPSVSPKKSWEGAAGSVIACVGGGAIVVPLALQGPWWAGAVVGLAVVVAATLGDLTESTIKRDLGVKDMGSILPGHGGLMDRLDSLLLTAPVVWAVLAALVPVG